MNIQSCCDKPVLPPVIRKPHDPREPSEKSRHLPLFSRSELYSFPDPEEDAEAVPDSEPAGPGTSRPKGHCE